MSNDQKSQFSESYSETSLWDKITNFAKNAGRELIELVLQLYYTMQAPETPAWAKTVIIGALGYFIFPADAIPDVVPVAGYSDDIGAITMALGTVASYVTQEIKKQAADQVEKLFGN